VTEKQERNKKTPQQAIKEIFQGSPSKVALNCVGILLCIVFIPLFLANMVLIIKSVANPDEVPSIFNVSPMIVLSGSMETEIYKGDLIFVKVIEAEDIKLDDIIAFYKDDHVVTHRVIAINQASNGDFYFTTQGDNNDGPDLFPVGEDRLVGIYTSRIAKMGDFAMFLQSPQGVITFIGTPIILYLLYDLIRRKLEEKNRATEVGSLSEDISSENEKLKAEIERLKALENKSEKDQKQVNDIEDKKDSKEKKEVDVEKENKVNDEK